MSLWPQRNWTMLRLRMEGIMCAAHEKTIHNLFEQMFVIVLEFRYNSPGLDLGAQIDPKPSQQLKTKDAQIFGPFVYQIPMSCEGSTCCHRKAGSRGAERGKGQRQSFCGNRGLPFWHVLLGCFGFHGLLQLPSWCNYHHGCLQGN